jgi:hypothetical protein
MKAWEKDFINIKRICFHGSVALSKHLGIKKRTNFNMSILNGNKCKEYFLSLINNELLELIYLIDVLKPLYEFNSKKHQAVAANITINNIQATAIRKWRELFLDIHLFSTQNDSENAFKHYLISHVLSEAKKKTNDWKEYYSCANKVVEAEIDSLIKIIDKINPLINNKWWIQGKHDVKSIKFKLVNTKDKYHIAHQDISKYEREIILETYQSGYGNISSRLHFNSISKNTLKLKDLNMQLIRLTNIVLFVLSRIEKVLKTDLKVFKDCTLQDVIKDTQIFHDKFNNELHKVLKKGQPFIFQSVFSKNKTLIVKKNTSVLNFHSFNVKYLEKNKFNITDDQCPFIFPS